jgi:hypothetical protein
MQKCLDCGAELKDDETCRERFDRCLAFEYEHPETYGAVHHLTVPCYMLQHNEYSKDAWSEARQMVAQFVHKNSSPQEMLKLNRVRYDRRHRKWRVTGGEKLARFDQVPWTRTIADVRLETPEQYCADVRLWADSVLKDTEFLF